MNEHPRCGFRSMTTGGAARCKANDPTLPIAISLSEECQNRTHLPKQIKILGTRAPSPTDTGTRGRDAPVEELKVINVARAPSRFRAFPDDTGIALKGDKLVARVGPIPCADFSEQSRLHACANRRVGRRFSSSGKSGRASLSLTCSPSLSFLILRSRSIVAK